MKTSAERLRLLAEVFDTGSVSEVALQLGMSQSSVSYALERLREDMNDPLLVKVGRTLEPTAFLRDRIPMIRRVVADLEGLRKKPTFKAARFTGSPIVLANVAEMMPLLGRVADAFRAAAPNARLRLLEMGSRANLLESFDKLLPVCALTVRSPSYPPELMTKPLWSSEQVIYYDAAQRGRVWSVAEYFDAEHAVLDFGGEAQSTVDQSVSPVGRKRKIRVGVPQVAALASMIKGTNLICTMQKSLHRSVFSGLSYCPVPLHVPPVLFDLVWHRRDNADVMGQWMRDLIVSESAAEQERITGQAPTGL